MLSTQRCQDSSTTQRSMEKMRGERIERWGDRSGEIAAEERWIKRLIGYRRAERRRELRGERSMEEVRNWSTTAAREGNYHLSNLNIWYCRELILIYFFFLVPRTADRHWTGSECPICVKLIPLGLGFVGNVLINTSTSETTDTNYSAFNYAKVAELIW